MKRIILFTVLFIFILGIFQSNLYSLISSRIEGVVIEEGTKNPIIGAELILFQFSKETGNKIWDFRTKSNEKGEFEFRTEEYSLLLSPKYFNIVQCTHNDYINLYSNIPMNINEDGKHFNSFVLKEGEIKYIKIELKRGGGIEGILKYQIGQKTQPLSNFIFGLERNINGNSAEVATLETDEKGNYKKNGIPPGSNYYLRFFFNGYTVKQSRHFLIKFGDFTRIDHIVNLVNNTGIKGYININDKIPNNGISVTLIKHDIKSENCNNCSCVFYSKFHEYHCYNLEPGKYNLIVTAINNRNLYKRIVEIEIKINKTVIYNINFSESEKQ